MRRPASRLRGQEEDPDGVRRGEQGWPEGHQRAEQHDRDGSDRPGPDRADFLGGAADHQGYAIVKRASSTASTQPVTEGAALSRCTISSSETTPASTMPKVSGR